MKIGSGANYLSNIICCHRKDTVYEFMNLPEKEKRSVSLQEGISWFKLHGPLQGLSLSCLWTPKSLQSRPPAMLCTINPVAGLASLSEPSSIWKTLLERVSSYYADSLLHNSPPLVLTVSSGATEHKTNLLWLGIIYESGHESTWQLVRLPYQASFLHLSGLL